MISFHFILVKCFAVVGSMTILQKHSKKHEKNHVSVLLVKLGNKQETNMLTKFAVIEKMFLLTH